MIGKRKNNNMIKEIVLFGTFQVIGIYTWIQTSKQIRQPYMDEFFHLDQLDHYLNGEWTYWNDKLTTPPGTYLLIFPFLKLGQLLGFKNILLGARLLNSFLLGTAIMVFLKKIFKEINSKENVLLSYYVLFTPTIYFFSHLFYTDSASLAVCLGMFYYSSKKRFAVSGLFGFLSILIRQTNAIWIIYICLINFIDENHKAFQEKILVASVCFVLQNGSIVLGDKQNHESSFHPTQLLYFSLFALLNLPLSVMSYLNNFKDTIKNQKMTFIISLIISLGIIHQFTFAHKFILSDNRHYIFYIWKNFYGRYAIFRYLMAPIYSFSVAFILNLFKNNGMQQIKLLALFFSSCLVLIPAGLVEFRYFTNSLVFLIILISQNSNLKEQQDIKKLQEQKENWILKVIPNSIVINIGIQILFNILLLYVFIYYPFINADGNIARFMF